MTRVGLQRHKKKKVTILYRSKIPGYANYKQPPQLAYTSRSQCQLAILI